MATQDELVRQLTDIANLYQPRRMQTAKILKLLDAGTQGHHLVMFYLGGYSMQHPLRERLPMLGPDGKPMSVPELLHCPEGNHIGEFGDQYVTGGVFGDAVELNVPYRCWFEGEGEDAALQLERVATAD